MDPVPTVIVQESCTSSMGLSDNVCDIIMEPSTTMSGMYLKNVAIKPIVSSKPN